MINIPINKYEVRQLPSCCARIIEKGGEMTNISQKLTPCYIVPIKMTQAALPILLGIPTGSTCHCIFSCASGGIRAKIRTCCALLQRKDSCSLHLQRCIVAFDIYFLVSIGFASTTRASTQKQHINHPPKNDGRR